MAHKFWQRCRHLVSGQEKATRLYQRAIAEWGIVSQIAQVAEESSELAVAALHFIRDPSKPNVLKLAEEAADVEIMIEQLYTLDGFRALKDKFRKAKLTRLRELLNKAEKEEENADKKPA